MTPKVYFDQRHSSGRVMIGPLGYWEIGDAVEVGDDIVHVTGLDLDGMAVAWTEESLLGRFGSVEEGHRQLDGRQATSHGTLTPAQRQACERIAACGRELRVQGT